MKVGDRIIIYPEDARREAVNATVERLTPSGFSLSAGLPDNRSLLLSRTEDGRWVEVATGRRYEIEKPQHACGC
jgi:hypothetical protein